VAHVQRALSDPKNLENETDNGETVAPAGQPADRAAGGQGAQNDADAGKAEPDDKRSLIRRHPYWTLVIVVLFAAVAVVGYFVWLIYYYPYETTDDAFVDARSFSVATKVSGYLDDIDVTDNQHIATGAVIARIAPRDYQIAIDQADAQVQSAAASVANAKAQIDVQSASIDQARAQEASSLAALQYAQDQAKRQNQLLAGGAGSQEAAQQAQSSLRQAQATYTQSQASVTSSMQNKTAAEAELNSAQASVKQAQAQRESAEQNLNYTRIVAAQPGRVVKLSGSKGQYVEAGQAIAMFVPDDIWVTANFKETQLTDMRPGQSVDVTLDAYPDHILHGKVASVQPGSGTAFSLLPAENATGNYVKVTQRVPVKIVIDQWPKDVTIGPGMSVLPTVTVHPEH
jgi:membrane fusion protein (multidrug efflux system)